MALEIRVSNLLPLISFATRAGSATQGDVDAIQAEVDALETTVAGKADETVTVTGGVLATGGGSLAADQVITVDKATGAETAALTIDTKAVTPFSLAAIIGSMNAAIEDMSDRVDELTEIVARTQPPALIIISHGQSLARRQPPMVTVGVTISNYFQPVGGTDADDFPNFTGNSEHLQKIDNFASFVPFAENAAGESWGSGLGYQFRRNSQIGPMIFFAPADGARHWRELRPGSGRWGNLVSYVLRAHEHFRQNGELNIQPRLFWTHIEAECDTVAPGGGTSELVITAAETQTIQEEVLRWYHHDMALIFGKDMSDLPVYITPLNSAHYDDATLAAPHPKAGAASRKAQAGQLAACLANPQLILLPPHYQFYLFMNGDGVHLGGQGRRYHAELCASVAERVEGGTAYIAPYVISATRSGVTITANCHFPGGSGGVRDTTTFADPGTTNWPGQKYGVQYWHSGTQTFVTVSDVTIAGSTMTVTLASDPGAGAGELRIAQLPWTTTATAATSWTARSNFRDATLQTVAQDSTILYHYMVPQTVSLA